MSRPKPLSGFPELLPEGRIVEQYVLDRLRRTFELHGFTPIETRAVEPLDRLAKQGEIDKEVYAVQRLHAEPGAAAELGLHFDLTVPFARYVLENAHRLSFPFRRYQIQKVWRGERPQEGRYREFTQADVDIIDADQLAAHHDVELPLVTLEALERLHVDLGVPPVLMRVNNRRLAQGFYLGLGIADPAAVLRQVDKIDKIGPDQVQALLVDEVEITAAQAKACVRLAQISAVDASFVDAVRALGVSHDQLDQGLELLADVVTTAGRYVPGRLIADLKIARGPGLLHRDGLRDRAGRVRVLGLHLLRRPLRRAGQRRPDHLSRGRVCPSASPGCWRRCSPAGCCGPPGRCRPRCWSRSPRRRAATRPSPWPSSSAPAASPARSAPAADKFGKQIRYADRRGIPYVWFGGLTGGEVKDLRSGEQVPAAPGVWRPPEDDLVPQVLSRDS